jgi:hypothetical protein
MVVLLLGVVIWFVRSRRAAGNARVQPWPGVQRVPALVPPVPAQQLRSPSRASATIAPSPMTVGSGTTAHVPSTPPAQAIPVEPASAALVEEPPDAAPQAPAPVDAAAAPEPVEPVEAVPAAPAVSESAASAARVEHESAAAPADQAAVAVAVPDEPVAPAPAAGEAQAKSVPATPPVSGTAAMFEPAAPATAGVVTTGSTSSPDDVETELLPVQPPVSWAQPVEPEPHSLFTPAPPRRATPRSDRPSPRRRKPSPSPQTAALPPGAVAAGPDGSAPGPEYTIKASTGSPLFHSPASPYFRRTKAEIWFRSAADARAAGFTEWTPKKRTES